MSGSIVRHSYISLTHSDAAGVVRTEVERTETVDDDDEAQPGDCFDPAACCDRQERIMIASLREYLRPTIAPDCLIKRLNAALDRCCCDVEEHYGQMRQSAAGGTLADRSDSTDDTRGERHNDNR